MLYIEIKLPTIKIVLTKSDVQNFCRYVINKFINGEINNLYDCGAVYSYNKLKGKINKNKTTLVLPLEYAMMLKTFCYNQQTNHDLFRIALYNMFEQLDKKMNS